jgi:thioredoxin-dependent peroxiredoxin
MSHQVTFKGNPLKVLGSPLQVGDTFPASKLVNGELSDVNISELLKDKVTFVLTVPSLDTPVCSTEVRTFNEKATGLSDKVHVIAVSKDLPFAQKRWCAAEGISKVHTLSDYKAGDFGEKTGTLIETLGLLSRTVFLVGPDAKIAYTQYVPEVTQEPHYEDALKACATLLG